MSNHVAISPSSITAAVKSVQDRFRQLRSVVTGHLPVGIQVPPTNSLLVIVSFLFFCERHLSAYLNI